ncbi:MAG: DDE-type integrase/transposase/recombinase [Oscillospiraceae bacterium]|jgi:transposase InsO family protein|nr:DDE-type integrase/transposase/recombinase [Oscillospiraceae bacterium]
MPNNQIAPMEIAHFRFALIAPVIQGLFPDSSATAYYQRITENPIVKPNGSSFAYRPKTLEKWTAQYKTGGMDALLPKERSDKGSTRTLDDVAIEEIFRLKEKYHRLNATQIHQLLVRDAFIPANVSVAAVQRFIRKHDLKSARNPNIKDRKAFEEPLFGCLWQADTCFLPHINENGKAKRTYLIMILDDFSRLIVGGQIFYNDNTYNFQTVFKRAIATYGIPDKLYTDSGAPYRNAQLTFICGSVGCVELHTPVRDGASKGKIERSFRTLRDRWLNSLDVSQIQSLTEFNELLSAYIYQYNTTVHSSIKETPLDRFLRTRDNIRAPKSQGWLDECFHNRVTRKVNNDSCITIDGVCYDAPQQFIGMKVDIRFLPTQMEDAYILYDGAHYPIPLTDKAANSRTKRNNLPTIDYSTGRGASVE